MAPLSTLQRENAELRTQLAKMATANAAQMSQLLATNAELTAQIAKLSERVNELLAVARRRQRPPTPPSPPAPPPLVEAEAQRAFADRPLPPPLPTREKKPPAPRRPTGRKPLPSHLEIEAHELRPDTCVHCGSDALDVADEVVEEKLHVVKEHQRRRVVRRTTCRCRGCGGRTTPRSLPC